MPILLAAFALGHGIDDAERIYDLVFVVVLASVLVQGTTIAPAAAPPRRADAARRSHAARRAVRRSGAADLSVTRAV